MRANLVCPGYQDPSQTIFLHETESTVCKVNKQSPRLPSPEKLMLPPVEDRAKDFFVSRFVYTTTARFPYMEHFWIARPDHTHLAMCVRAVSLAYLSFELHSPEILQRARHRYTSALALTNMALRSMKTAMHNATLLTVILLDMTEKFTQILANEAWDNWRHLNGALALLQLGGASQFDDIIRLRLFRQLSFTILLRCLRAGKDIPPALLTLRQSINADDQDGKLEALVLNFVMLRREVDTGMIQEDEMAVEVGKLDDGLLRICSRRPKWMFVDVIAGNINHKEFVIDLMGAVDAVVK